MRVNEAWDAAVVWARAELALWLPIALAFFALPTLALSLARIDMTALASGQPDPATSALALATLLVSLFGNLAIATLVLRSGGSVGEALAHAARRYGPAVLTALPILLCAVVYLLVAMIAVALALGAGGVQLTAATAAKPSPGLLLLVLAILLPLIAGVVRLSTVWPSMAAGERPGWRTALAVVRSTGPIGWRLGVVWILFGITEAVVQLAIAQAVGAIGLLATGGIGSDSVPFGVAAAMGVATAIVYAMAEGFWIVFVTFVYRLLPRPSSGT